MECFNADKEKRTAKQAITPDVREKVIFGNTGIRERKLRQGSVDACQFFLQKKQKKT